MLLVVPSGGRRFHLPIISDIPKYKSSLIRIIGIAIISEIRKRWRHAGYQDDRAGTGEARQDQGRSGDGDGRPPRRGIGNPVRAAPDQGGGNYAHPRLS